jgi:hypothetical protein
MQQPFFQRLESSKTVLLAGAGGGFDVFCGLPLMHWLLTAGKTVHLANLSFTNLSMIEGPRPHPSLVRVDRHSTGPVEYFPEAHLVDFLNLAGDFSAFPQLSDSVIYAIENNGAAGVRSAYQWMVQELQPDTIIVIDGGTDMLMRGDERGLGTPEEDWSTLVAAHEVQVETKLLACLGFGIDAFHGVCHHHFLENVSALIKTGGYLGCWGLNASDPGFEFFQSACKSAFRRMPDILSIVNGSILDAVNGEFGDFHSTPRTRGSELFINPLMSLFWGFDIDKVAEQNLFLNQIRETTTRRELARTIESLHDHLPSHRQTIDLPL